MSYDKVRSTMSCLPQSGGGCERPFTDAFADHLNDVEGARYKHQSCLDINNRMHPQPDSEPEALYLDLERNTHLVIERKSICWPTDYFHRHSNDHFVSGLFEQGLKGLTIETVYEIGLPMLVRGSQTELTSFVRLAVESIRVNWPKIVEGEVLRGHSGAELWWSCRRCQSTRSRGWRFNFVGQVDSSLEYIDAANLPEALASDLKKIYSSCEKKFTGYPDARRVLVLEPHEDLRYESGDWWHTVFSSLPPPSEIGEVWLGTFDYVTDESKAWFFEKVY